MENDRMSIQWYPGHMTKTRRQIEADLKLVDAVCEYYFHDSIVYACYGICSCSAEYWGWTL